MNPPSRPAREPLARHEISLARMEEWIRRAAALRLQADEEAHQLQRSSMLSRHGNFVSQRSSARQLRRVLDNFGSPAWRALASVTVADDHPGGVGDGLVDALVLEYLSHSGNGSCYQALRGELHLEAEALLSPRLRKRARGSNHLLVDEVDDSAEMQGLRDREHAIHSVLNGEIRNVIPLIAFAEPELRFAAGRQAVTEELRAGSDMLRPLLAVQKYLPDLTDEMLPEYEALMAAVADSASECPPLEGLQLIRKPQEGRVAKIGDRREGLARSINNLLYVQQHSCGPSTADDSCCPLEWLMHWVVAEQTRMSQNYEFPLLPLAVATARSNGQ